MKMIVSVSLLLTVLLSNCEAAPVRYDQRQNGDHNVQADLDNILIVISTSGNNSIFSSIAAQVLEFRNKASRHASKKAEDDVDSSRYEIEETHERSKEPYRVEIVHIEKPEEVSLRIGNGPLKTEGKLEQVEPLDDSKKSESKDLLSSEDGRKESRSLWKHDGRSIQGKLGKIEKSESQKLEKNSDGLKNLEKIEEAGRSQVVIENVNELKTPGLSADLGRPGQSLKKELSSKEEKLQMEDREKIDVGTLESKPEELPRISDPEMECGPGQYRDNAGTCQSAAAN